MRAHRLSTVLLAALAGPAAAGAQSVTPPDWKWVTDRPASVVGDQEIPEGGWRFVEMAPGWHVTMGPGGILYDPAHMVESRYAVEAEIFLFPRSGEAGYGIFTGGRNLDSANRSYFAFLARFDGSAGIFHYAGDEVHTIVDWSRSATVLPGKPDGTAKNVVRVEAEMDSVRFLVNGQRVAALQRPDGLAGHVGLRVGAGVNLHASNLDITHRLAPVPPPGR